MCLFSISGEFLCFIVLWQLHPAFILTLCFFFVLYFLKFFCTLFKKNFFIVLFFPFLCLIDSLSVFLFSFFLSIFVIFFGQIFFEWRGEDIDYFLYKKYFFLSSLFSFKFYSRYFCCPWPSFEGQVKEDAIKYSKRRNFQRSIDRQIRQF